MRCSDELEAYKEEKKYEMKLVLLAFLLILVFLLTAAAFGETRIFFSPLDNVSRVIVDEISEAQHSIDVAIFGFTDLEIMNALIAAKQRGVLVRIYRDKLQSKESKQKAVNKSLQDNKIPVRIKTTGFLMHMKCMIIDDRTLVTGSYNWSEGAKKQDNDLMICEAPCNILPKYKSKFKEMGFEYGR